VLPTKVEPLRRDFPAQKAMAWHYKIHHYYTKQPSNMEGEYIGHFCHESGLMADPICGRGVTCIEALINKCRAVCLELHPLAVFITRMTYFAPVDIDAYWEAYRQVEQEMRPIVDFVRNALHQELEKYELKGWYLKGVRIPGYVD
jgi:hypothetical protein